MRNVLNGWLIALIATGLISRAAAIFDAQRVLWQWPTEDGYLMMTIAENVALGHGMAVSDGLVSTNGTQPLCTFLWSLAFRITPDREAAVGVVQGFELVIAILTALALRRVALRWLRGRDNASDIAALAAAAWWASPAVVLHTMNCLETGMYALAVVCVVGSIGSTDTLGGWSWSRCLKIGALLSWAFYARNDAVFLIAAVCLSHWWSGVRHTRRWFNRTLLESTVVGATTIVAAVPWLLYNLTFGHITPISGVSESYEAPFGANLGIVPIKLFEYATLYLPIPESLESKLLVLGIALSALVALGIWVLGPRHPERFIPLEERQCVLLFGFALCFYYGALFGAPHFVVRYLFPLSLFFAVGWAGILLRIVAAARRPRALLIALAIGTTASAAVSALHSRMRGTDNGHRSMVAFVETNASPEDWVASSQSGTLGFFHRRTYNLDGKVSPEALEARLEGRIPEYVAEKTEIRYVLDWMALLDWYQRFEVLRSTFDLVLEDPVHDLAVLERRSG